MRRAIVVVATLAVAGSVAGWAVASLPLFSPPKEITQFGYVASVTPKGKSYVLRFDPALWLEGQTANVAAAEDGEVTRAGRRALDRWLDATKPSH